MIVHFMNKYPGGRVQSSESSMDVFSQDGQHLLALRKNGAGQWVDESETLGASERFDLSPIPRDARVYKVADGKIKRDEKADEREAAREKFKSGVKILSIEELEKMGHRFDQKGDSVGEAPKARAEAQPAAQPVGNA